MIVTDLDKMEAIVSRRRNLMWDGWDVVETRPSPTAFFYSDGRRIGGKWFRTKRYPLTEKGWKVPNELFKT